MMLSDKKTTKTQSAYAPLQNVVFEHLCRALREIYQDRPHLSFQKRPRGKHQTFELLPAGGARFVLGLLHCPLEITTNVGASARQLSSSYPLGASSASGHPQCCAALPPSPGTCIVPCKWAASLWGCLRQEASSFWGFHHQLGSLLLEQAPLPLGILTLGFLPASVHGHFEVSAPQLKS
jgi:hypothetical protein